MVFKTNILLYNMTLYRHTELCDVGEYPNFQTELAALLWIKKKHMLQN